MRNLSIVLLVLACPASIFCQREKSTWKEYKFAADGFALTVPTFPTPHHSPVLRGATAYVIPLNEVRGGVVLRVKKGADCNNVISRRKEQIRSEKNSAVDPSSVRDVSIEGHAGLEYRWQRSKTYTILERWYCVDERLYVFSVNWLRAKPFPARATMILDSFRPLPKEQPSR